MAIDSVYACVQFRTPIGELQRRVGVGFVWERSVGRQRPQRPSGARAAVLRTPLPRTLRLSSDDGDEKTLN